MNHLANFANKTANQLPRATPLPEEVAASLNLVKVKDYNLGSNCFDEIIPEQLYFGISFCPAAGATPNNENVFAYYKIRGVYATEEEAIEKCTMKIVATQDALTNIYIHRVGHPIPLATDIELPSQQITEVDMANNLLKSFRNYSKKQKKKNDEIVKELEERKKVLQAGEKEITELEKYAELRAKMANWSLTLSDVRATVKDLENRMIEGHKVIVEADEKNPTFQEEYLELILKENESCGFVKGKTEDMDKIIDERISRLVNYKQNNADLFESFSR